MERDALELEGDVEAVQEVAAEDERVDGREDGVDPAGGDEQRLALVQRHAVAGAVDDVAQEGLVHGRRRHPALVGCQVRRRRWHEVEHLLALRARVPFYFFHSLEEQRRVALWRVHRP